MPAKTTVGGAAAQSLRPTQSMRVERRLHRNTGQGTAGGSGIIARKTSKRRGLRRGVTGASRRDLMVVRAPQLGGSSQRQSSRSLLDRKAGGGGGGEARNRAGSVPAKGRGGGGAADGSVGRARSQSHGRARGPSGDSTGRGGGSPKSGAMTRSKSHGARMRGAAAGRGGAGPGQPTSGQIQKAASQANGGAGADGKKKGQDGCPPPSLGCVGNYVGTSLMEIVGGSADRRVQDSSYETMLLWNTMVKIGGLLQVGFGEAGGEIISKNMAQGQGKLDPLIKGTKIDAVFGFCDIRRFTDATECLQEDVMVFVNTIGSIVHSAVHRLSGAANKNIGDAFLLTWKLPRIDEQTAKARRDMLHQALRTANERSSTATGAGVLELPPGGGQASFSKGAPTSARSRSGRMDESGVLDALEETEVAPLDPEEDDDGEGEGDGDEALLVEDIQGDGVQGRKGGEAGPKEREKRMSGAPGARRSSGTGRVIQTGHAANVGLRLAADDYYGGAGQLGGRAISAPVGGGMAVSQPGKRVSFDSAVIEGGEEETKGAARGGAPSSSSS